MASVTPSPLLPPDPGQPVTQHRVAAAGHAFVQHLAADGEVLDYFNSQSMLSVPSPVEQATPRRAVAVVVIHPWPLLRVERHYLPTDLSEAFEVACRVEQLLRKV